MAFIGRSRFFPGWLGWLLALLACALVAGPAAAQRKPNILFFLTDDMDYSELQFMPKTRRLIGEPGVEFTNSFVSLSLCCPSRAAILRGQFAHNNGVVGNSMPYGGFEKFNLSGQESSTVATWLQSAGYRTAMIGKYLNGYPTPAAGESYIPPGWDYWFSPNGGLPYDQYNYTVNFNGSTLSFGARPWEHLNEVLTGRARRFIANMAAVAPNRPYFLFVSPLLPHLPATVPARYETLFADAKVPRVPSFNEADMRDKPTYLRNRPLLTDEQIADTDAIYRQRLRATAALDDMVETLVEALRASGQLANTYVFFASDNGFHQGHHRMPSGKGRIYEEDIKVPLLVRGPGVGAGRRLPQLVANVDYAPTFAAIAGVPVPSFVDGRSLLPLLQGRTPARWRQSLLLESPRYSAEDALPRALPLGGPLEPPDPDQVHDAVLLQPDAATRGTASNFDGLRTASGQTFALYGNGDGEYYDLGVDPYQLSNRYGSMSPTLKDALTRQLEQLRTARGQALRTAEEVAAGAVR